jgi:glycosyltransferase involved in cell wall biosynthesis
MFEYMMMGRPVVVSSFPLWQGIVAQADCGYAVDPLDPEAAAGAVHRLLADPAERERLGSRGRQAVLRTYNWEAEGRRLVELYRSLLPD